MAEDNGARLPRIVVAQLGARMHYAVPRIFHEAGMLERLFTDSYIGNKPWLEGCLSSIPRCIRPRVVDRWLGRKEAALPPGKVTSFEVLGGAYLTRRLLSSSLGGLPKLHVAYGDLFNRQILKEGLGAATAVWGFTGGAATLLRAAGERGLVRIFEQADHARKAGREILTEENARWPGWQRGLTTELEKGGYAALERLEEEELGSSDIIVVASNYTKQTLVKLGYSAAKIIIVPYGVDIKNRGPRPRTLRAHAKSPTLRVLYIGAVDLRKGVPYLLTALNRLRSRAIIARIAGPIRLCRKALAPFEKGVEFLGAVPRTRVPELFRASDLVVFPTLGEGFGIVQVEAIAEGVPVIATPNCGEVIREGVEGHIVPPRDADAIADLMDRYAGRPQDLVSLREAALRRRHAFSLEAYGARLLAAVAS